MVHRGNKNTNTKKYRNGVIGYYPDRQNNAGNDIFNFKIRLIIESADGFTTPTPQSYLDAITFDGLKHYKTIKKPDNFQMRYFDLCYVSDLTKTGEVKRTVYQPYHLNDLSRSKQLLSDLMVTNPIADSYTYYGEEQTNNLRLREDYNL